MFGRLDWTYWCKPRLYSEPKPGLLAGGEETSLNFEFAAAPPILNIKLVKYDNK